MAEHPDLDGVRLSKPDGPDVWLVFHGKRHRIVSPAVYESLFADASGILFNPAIDDIATGSDLNDGTCLVRFEGRPDIYLATESGPNAQIMHIPSYEVFVDFGFDLTKVREIPAVLFEVIPKGPTLTSAPDRAARTM